MKYCIYLLALLMPYATQAQHTAKWDDSLIGKRQWEVPPLPYDGKEIVYREKISLTPSFSRERIYTNAKDWLTHNLKTDYSSITEASASDGRIKGKGELYYDQQVLLNGVPQSIFFSYDIDISDGAWTYTIYDLHAKLPHEKFDYTDMYREELQEHGTARWTHKYRYEMLSDMDSFMKLFISGLKNSIASNN